VIVRSPRSEDFDAIVAIEQASFSDPWEPANFRRLVAPPAEHCRVAELEGRVVGYWIGSRIDDEAELANLAVDPNVRRVGVGALLLEDFLRHVGAVARTTVFLEVRASNAPAMVLYRRFGFVELARRKGYYTKPIEDAAVMARKPAEIRFHAK
jgi:ribosomal-protein-alanine N-acetyltransferase